MRRTLRAISLLVDLFDAVFAHGHTALVQGLIVGPNTNHYKICKASVRPRRDTGASVQDAARPRPCPSAVFERYLTIDDHADALGVLMRVFECGGVLHGIRVESQSHPDSCTF